MKHAPFCLFLLGTFSLIHVSSAVTVPFSAASDYDNNFYELTNPGDTTWSSASGGSLAKSVQNSATVAIFNTTATGGSAGSGGTGAATLDNNTFSNFTYQLDFSVPELVVGGDSAGFITKINASGSSGYFAIFRLVGPGSADFRIWDSDSVVSTGALGTQIFGQNFTVPANSFLINTYYTLRLDVADVGSNVQFTGSIYTQGGGAQIGNSLSFTDTTSAVTGAGQVGLRLGSNSPTATSYKNFSVTATPEPTAASLLGVAGMGLLARRRRRELPRSAGNLAGI